MEKYKWKIKVIPGSHFDLGWTSTPGESLARGDEIIKEAIDAISGDFPDYRFTIEYTLFLKHFLDSYPNYLNKVKKLLKENKISLGASWTGMMDQVLDGESVIRNITLAKRWAKENLDIDLKVAQLTDCPGHGAQLAQILNKCGVKYLAYSRYSPPIPLHFWEGLDGSRIIAVNHSLGLYKGIGKGWPSSGYGWGFILREGIKRIEKELPEQLRKIEKVWPKYRLSSNLLRHFPVLMGDESDLIMGKPEICKIIKEWNKENKEINFKIFTIEEFFKEIESLVLSSKDKLPVFRGEAPYEFYSLPACFPKIFKISREAENKLLSAEKFSTLKKTLNLKETFPHNEMDKAWENLTFPQDHNTGGMHGKINDRVRLNKARESLDIASSLIEEVTYSIASNIAYKREGIPVVVFNPLSWEREEIVKADVIFKGKEVEEILVKDLNGESVSSQLIKKEIISSSTKLKFIFLAKVSPLGYRTYYVYPGEKKELRPILHTLNNLSFENNSFKITFSLRGVKNIQYKGREFVLKDKYNFGQIFVLEDTADDVRENFTGKEWKAYYDLSTLRIVENGPLRAKIRWEGKVLNSRIIQEIIFYSSISRLDLSTTINWEGRKSTQVRLAYPFNIPGAKITYEIPYGSITYPDEEIPHTYRGTGGRYIQKWIDISNKDYGITMATQNSSHSLSSPSIIYPVLIRTTFSCGDRFYWYYNQGRHTFSHSFIPHQGDWKKEHTYRLGWEYNNPLIVDERRTCLFYRPKEGGEILPEEFSLLSVEEPNIVITTVKEADNKEGWIIRLFEAEGKRGLANINLSFPIKKAWEVDLLERKIKEIECDGKKVKLKISPYGIYTILVKKQE
ncbi:hypothetical protein J7K28_00575 [Candidatus Aerophobetes bacterium]|nr:hypothetical protein [Candidatus Aerophobetes bacterium]